MTSPRDGDRIAHMIEACEQAAEFVAGRTRADLDHDRMLQLALVKLIEIIGEAAKAVSEDTRARYPDVPWSTAARTRDRLTHHYFEVDPRPTLGHRDREPAGARGSASEAALLTDGAGTSGATSEGSSRAGPAASRQSGHGHRALDPSGRSRCRVPTGEPCRASRCGRLRAVPGAW